MKIQIQESWDSGRRVMPIHRKLGASVQRTAKVTAEILVRYGSPAELAHPEKIAMDVTSLNPNPISVVFRPSDDSSSWYDEMDD